MEEENLLVIRDRKKNIENEKWAYEVGRIDTVEEEGKWIYTDTEIIELETKLNIGDVIKEIKTKVRYEKM